MIIFTNAFALAARGGLAGPEDQMEFNPASDTEGNHCINRFGQDLNEVLGVSEQFLLGSCLTVNSGEFYIPYSGFWNVNSVDGVSGFPLVYPEGYVPAKPAPVDDLISKTSLKYVVDGYKTYLYPGEDVMKVILTGALRPSGFPPLPPEALTAISVAKLHPLSIGAHSVAVSAILSAEHCDGSGTIEAQSCLPPGELPIRTFFFHVVPGAAQSQ